MSRNNKNAQRIVAARVFSKMHANGNKGPAKTSAKHGKKRAWWQIFPSYSAFIKGEKARRRAAEAAAA